MHALLINLETSVDRLEFQNQQLNKLGISYEIVKAISADQITETGYREKALNWERPLRRSELACFMSHFNAWEEVANSNTPALILEDDALLSVNTPDVLSALSNELHFKYDLITLETRGRKKIIDKESIPLTKNINLIKLYQDRTGAAGYILSPTGAHKLLKAYRSRGAALADAFISSSYMLNAYQVEPAPIIQLDQCTTYSITTTFSPESTISTESKPDYFLKSFNDIIRFKLKRVHSQLRIAFRQISVIRNSEKRYISIQRDGFTPSINTISAEETVVVERPVT